MSRQRVNGWRKQKINKSVYKNVLSEREAKLAG